MQLQHIETKYITPLRFIKTKEQVPLTAVNRFNKPLTASVSKLQQLKRSHVGLELTRTGKKQSRALKMIPLELIYIYI